jgi:BlaI family penicillinase repressor
VSEKMKRLGDAELEIMQVLWQRDEPVTSNYILQQVQGKRRWVLSSLMTSLARLADKGFVSCDRSTRTNFYSAVIGEKEYQTCESKSFLERLYGNSITDLIVNLYESKGISQNDISKLRTVLNDLEENAEDD